MKRHLMRCLWFSSLLVAHTLVIHGLEAIAQLVGSTERVSRSDLVTIQEWGQGLQPNGALNVPIRMENIYGYCPRDANWLHELEFDPDTQIVFIVRNCQLIQISYRWTDR